MASATLVASGRGTHITAPKDSVVLRGGNIWWIDAHAGASRWQLPLLPYAEPVTVCAGLVHSEPATLHMVWRALRRCSVAREGWVVRIATTRAPILVVGTASPDTQPWSESGDGVGPCTSRRSQTKVEQEGNQYASG